MKLQIIVGSTRSGRASERVARWVHASALANGRFEEIAVLDLKDWDLPMFDESRETVGDLADPTYRSPVVKRWNETIKQGDAYVFVTPEYNHSVPGVLKNAIDSVYFSYAFRNKPAGFVGYSTGIVGGARAVEHLAHIAIEAEMVPLRDTVLISSIGNAFDDSGQPRDPVSQVVMDIMFEDLGWWGSLLTEGRARGQTPSRRPPKDGSHRQASYCSHSQCEITPEPATSDECTAPPSDLRRLNERLPVDQTDGAHIGIQTSSVSRAKRTSTGIPIRDVLDRHIDHVPHHPNPLFQFDDGEDVGTKCIERRGAVLADDGESMHHTLSRSLDPLHVPCAGLAEIARVELGHPAAQAPLDHQLPLFRPVPERLRVLVDHRQRPGRRHIVPSLRLSSAGSRTR